MIMLVFGIVACIFLVPVAFFIWMHSAPQQAGDADALIVLGYRCDDDELHPLLQDRLDAVLDLLGKYKYQRIIVSGGAVASSRTEAEIMKQYLMERGVPEEKIILEDRSRNTVHNVVNSSILMQEHGLKSCLLVSNSFHIRRMRFIMNELDIPASYYANRDLLTIMKQWRITFQEIRAFQLTKPWLAKVKRMDSFKLMG